VELSQWKFGHELHEFLEIFMIILEIRGRKTALHD